MVTAPWRTGLPSGQPAIARMCCSNCETEAPSSVQWPELCTRGAISLTRTFGPFSLVQHEHLDREHADIVERGRDLAGDRAGLLRKRSGIAAGAREIFRMWSRCSFSVTSKHSTLPSAERAAITEISRSNGMKASRIADLVPSSAQMRSEIVARRE